MLETLSIPSYSSSDSDNATGADNQQERLARLGYLAGIIDGEGWVGVSKTRRSDVRAGFILLPQVSVHMVTKTGIEHIDHLFRSLGLPSYYSHRKDSSQWNVNGYTRVPLVLEALLPYLCIKKQQAEKLILLRDLRKQRSGRSSPTELELQIREEICALNTKGKNPQRLYATDL